MSGGHRESRMGLGIGYTAYQSGYNKLFTQVQLIHLKPAVMNILPTEA